MYVLLLLSYGAFYIDSRHVKKLLDFLLFYYTHLQWWSLRLFKFAQVTLNDFFHNGMQRDSEVSQRARESTMRRNRVYN